MNGMTGVTGLARMTEDDEMVGMAGVTGMTRMTDDDWYD